jgi:hypothetical protein
MTAYMIRADRVLHVAHIPDPAIPAHREPAQYSRTRAGQPVTLTPGSHDGRTLCGLPMLSSEQWIPYTPDPKHCPVCTACQDSANGYTQEAML